MFEPSVSRADTRLCPGKQKHVTTVYHVIWAELSEARLTVSFVEKKGKTRTVCIRARLWGNTRAEAAEWVEDLLNVAYKGTIPLPKSLRTGVNLACTRRQAEQEVEGARESLLRQGEAFVPSPFRMLGGPSGPGSQTTNSQQPFQIF